MHYFIARQTVQENDIRKPFQTKLPTDLLALIKKFQEDERKHVPRKYFEMVLDQCLELMNLRNVVKLVGSYKNAIQQGLDEEEDKNWNIQIKQAKAKLVETNYQLFDMFEPKPKQGAFFAQEKPFPQQNSEELNRQLSQLDQTKKVIKLLSGLIEKALNKQQMQQQLPKIENVIPKEMKSTLNLLRSYLDLKQTLSQLVIEQMPLPQQNSNQLGHQLASLNQIRQAISLVSELIGKALNNQQVHEQLSKIENMIPKEMQMQNMLTLLKNHLSLKQTLENEFLKKLKAIDRCLIREKEDLAPIEDHKDGHQINHIYQRISTFLEKNKASLENLRIFNQEVVDCLRSFILQILQPLQKRKKEEIDVINILTNIGDVKHELQRVLASYKDYIQVNDQNSQEMEVRLKDFKAEDEENKKKLQSLEEDNKEKDENIKTLTQEVKETKTKLAEVEKKLEQKTEAYSQVCRNNDILNITKYQLQQQNKTMKGKLSTIRIKLTNLDVKRKNIQSAQLQMKQYTNQMEGMKVFFNSLEKVVTNIQALTAKLSDSEENLRRLELAYKESNRELSMKAQQLLEKDKEIKVQLEESEKIRERERQEYDSHIKVLDNEIKELTLRIQAINKANSSLKLDINEMRKRQADAIRENQELSKKISNQRDYQRYFAHEVLYDFSFYKKPIIDTIENRSYLSVRASKLLFKFDPLNKVNFHRYIDEIPNILVLVKLANGRMLACYTNQPFKPQCTGEDAFIMVLNTGNIYELKKGYRAISYDEYYLLFGNSEIRLRSGESLIFSNFGIANSNFDNKGQSVDALFGEGKDKRELPITGYEIYQIIFEEER